MAKREWQVRDPEKTTGVAEQVSSMFEEVGAPSEIARQLGSEVHRLLLREAPKLRIVLDSLSTTESSDPDPDADNDIPF